MLDSRLYSPQGRLDCLVGTWLILMQNRFNSDLIAIHDIIKLVYINQGLE